MPKTPRKMHIYDIVKIDTMIFEIVWGGVFKAPPPLRIVSYLKYTGSDRDNSIQSGIYDTANDPVGGGGEDL